MSAEGTFLFELVHEACALPACLLSHMPSDGMLISAVHYARLDGTPLRADQPALCCSCGLELDAADFKPSNVRAHQS